MTIIRPPKNKTISRGSDVTIKCGYSGATVLPVTWIINGTSFTQSKVANNPFYQLNNAASPKIVSLTVFSINGTTTFQCIVHSALNTTSTHATVTVLGMYICIEYDVMILSCVCYIPLPKHTSCKK